MKTLKKLKVAAAVATMFATVAGVQAATISQSGGTLAMETIQPGNLPTPQSNFTRVRAPAVTYSYANGPNAQANGTQSFQIVFTLGGDGGPLYAFSAATSGEVPGLLTPPGGVPLMNRNAALTAETISAQLRGAVPASRVNVRATDPAAGRFAIVLRSIDVGNTLPGSDLAVHPNDNRSVTYRFDLVNNTAAPIALSDLDITFNTTKVAGAPTDYFTCEAGAPACRQDPDTPTTLNAEFAAIHNLASAVVATTGHSNTAFFNSPACGPDPIPRITLRGNSGINNFQGTEPNTNVPSTTVPTYNPSYVQIRRALDVIVSNLGNPNRLVATTNSFAENYSAFGLIGQNLTPTNNVGGQGGGRYTFVPTVKAVPSIGFGPALNPTVAGPAGPFTAGAASSGDERDALLGGISFRNRAVSAADRLMLADFYRFKPGIPAPAANAAAWDFGTAGIPNVAGGVDIRSPLFALRMVVKQTGTLAAGGSLRLINLAAMPVGQQTCATSAGFGTGFTITPTGNPGEFNWDVSHAQLQTAADPTGALGAAATLAGVDLSVCYNVPGNTTIPQATWTGIIATLFKDDITEQNNVSCPGDLAQVYGGVKIDVRNFVHSGAPGAVPGWQGILRVINNSETDTAQVDAQYIYNDGRYGNWGTIIPALPPRGAGYVTGADIYGKLTNVAASVAAGSRWDGQPTAAQINSRVAAGTAGNGTVRIRVSADVPTLRVQNYIYNEQTQALTEVSSSQGADFANIESSNRDHIDQDAQTDIKK